MALFFPDSSVIKYHTEAAWKTLVLNFVCVSVQLMRKRCDLKKKLRVTFVGEAGLDMGGLTKEWFLLLVRQIFHTDYGEIPYRKHISEGQL